MTYRLQSLDVGINRPFKVEMTNFYEDWLIASPKDAKITRELASKWVTESWRRMKALHIINTVNGVGYIGNVRFVR